MKKIFLNITLGLFLVFGFLSLTHVQASVLGCCYVDLDDPPTRCKQNLLEESECVHPPSAVWAWKAGACPSSCVIATPVPANDNKQSGCTFNDQGEAKCLLENPIGATEVPDIIRIVITAALGLIGAFTLIMFIWGGSTWLFSAGNPEKVSAGTQTMVWAVIGVLVVFVSYLWLSGFLKYLTG